MIIMKAETCEEVRDFAARMIQKSHNMNDTVLGEFNQHTFEATPTSSINEVIKPYDDHGWRSYFRDGGDFIE